MAADQIWHSHIWSKSLWCHFKTSPNIIFRVNLTIYRLKRNLKFWPKIKGQPLWKNLRWRLINFDILIFCQNDFYFTLKHQNIIFRSHLTIYKVLRNLKFWPQIIRLPLWEKIQDGGCWNFTSSYMERITLISL